MAERPAAPWSDLGIRALSAAILIPAVILDVWVGGVWFDLLVAVIAVLMALEWTNLVHGRDSRQFALHGAAAMAAAFLPLHADAGAALAVIAALGLVSILLARAAAADGSLWRYLGVPYVGLPAMALVLLRNGSAMGVEAIIWVLVTVWAADTLAYFAGRMIGGPKLAPVLSPKKTWAGLGGAVAGAAIASLLFAAVAGLPGPWPLALLAACLALVEQAGDLFKSAMKRHYGVKDSGDLIPGHGGVIDRVDGLVAVAVAALLVGLARNGADAGAGLLVW